MGVFAKTLLQLLAAAVLLAIGFFFPSALASTLSWLDATAASIADNAEPTGTLKLILQFAGAGFTVLMAVLVIVAGFTMRQFVSQTLFRWRYVLTAGLIPLLAHVVKWGLGLWWPALLVPVHTLTGGVYNWFSPETQIQLDLFNFKGHVITIILSLVLIMLWSLVTFLWRWFFGRKAAASAPSPQPPAPSGNAKGKIMSIFTKPLQRVRSKVAQIFSRPTNWVKSKFRKNPAPAAVVQQPQPSQPQPPVGKWKSIIDWLKFGLRLPLLLLRFVWWVLTLPWRQWGRKGIYLGPISVWFFLIVLFAGLSSLPVGALWLLRIWFGNGGLSDWPIVLTIVSTMTICGLAFVSDKKSTVPESLMIALTILGFRIRIYLKEGNYFLDLDNFLVGRTTKVVEPFTDSEGRFPADFFPFPVWDSTDRNSDEKPNLDIDINSLGGARVKLRVTLKCRHKDAQQSLSLSDGPLLLGDSSRKALRHTSGKFSDFDIDSTPPLIGSVMLGHTVISVRLADTYKRNIVGSLIFKKGGEKLYRIVPFGSSEEEIATAIVEFERTLTAERANIEDTVWALCCENDKPRTERISIESTVLSTAAEAEIEIDEVLVSDVEFAPPVQAAVNKASAEPHEAASELATAKSAGQAAAEFAEAEKMHGTGATALGAAATGTPGVQNINIPGLKEVAAALVTAFTPKPPPKRRRTTK
ncbi:MAG: hypothetical protein KBD44_01640 [Candidatus Pacebacteria bacterium]|nr:hypothetical protein [Candidatus Paceibacterota bacterium]